FRSYLLGHSYIKALPTMAKDGERAFVPYESSALLGSMGMFRELAGSPEDTVRDALSRDGLRGGMVASRGNSSALNPVTALASPANGPAGARNWVQTPPESTELPAGPAVAGHRVSAPPPARIPCCRSGSRPGISTGLTAGLPP